MAFWNRSARRASATRAWISITTRASGPSVLLREAARHARIAVLEVVNFDDRTAAVSPRLRGIDQVADAGAPLPLTARDRRRLEALLRDVRHREGVTDVVFETHVTGRDDASAECHLPLHELLTLVEGGGLTAGTRYVTD